MDLGWYSTVALGWGWPRAGLEQPLTSEKLFLDFLVVEGDSHRVTDTYMALGKQRDWEMRKSLSSRFEITFFPTSVTLNSKWEPRG